jgi:hypothetical protein
MFGGHQAPGMVLLLLLQVPQAGVRAAAEAAIPAAEAAEAAQEDIERSYISILKRFFHLPDM